MDIIKKYFPDLTQDQVEKFTKLQDLYIYWNEQINVISRKDIEQLYERHVLHSLGIAKLISFSPGSHILDVGTGGGFPGIPLAILFPESNFHLVDSIGKKIKVVTEISNALELDNVQATHGRAEKVKENFDFIVSRAVTRMNKFLPWVRNKIKQNQNHTLHNGVLYLKGGDIEEEMEEINYPYRYLDLKDVFEEEFFETKKVVYVNLQH